MCVPASQPEEDAHHYAEPLPPPDEKYQPSWYPDEKKSEYYSDAKDDFNKEVEYVYDPEADNNGYKWDEYMQEWVYQLSQQEEKATDEYNYNDAEVVEDEAQNNFYFYNTFSGQAVWFEPLGWEDIVHSEWNGWWLCREEMTGIEYW